MKKILGLASLLVLLSGMTVYAEVNNLEWLVDFEEAKRISAEKELPVLAFFTGSDWCGWCKKLDREVLSTKEFAAYAASSLVLFMADFPSRKKIPKKEKVQNEKLAEKYGVRGFPTVMLLSADGKVIGKTGYRRNGGKAYVKHLRKLIAKGGE
jgi:protein disulfide-isomerase